MPKFKQFSTAASMQKPCRTLLLRNKRIILTSSMSEYLLEPGGLSCYQSPLLAAFPELTHGFFTRRGGVSLGAYDSLNLSFNVGDRREAVAENRRRVREALGLRALASASQKHGRRGVVVAAESWPRP